MEILNHLFHGFSVALQPLNFFYLVVGVLGGTLVGVLPAIGPLQAVALLLPSIYRLEPIGAIIMLSGVWYGAMYGGSTTSILVNVPGEASSVVTCLDGYPLAKQGRAGAALGMAAFASFIAGTIGVVGLMLFAPILGRAALSFGYPEYFTLMLMALTTISFMAKGSMVKSVVMVGSGLVLSTVGMDPIGGHFRFTFGTMFLQDGLHIIPIVIGLFGLREVLVMFQTEFRGEILKKKVQGFLPTLQDWKDSIFPILRGSALGFFMGILPGVSPMIPTFLSYGIEKKISRHPEKFGNGAIEGVAAPEACNNATVNGMQIPLFSLGIPTNAMNAMLLAALMIFGMTPGPQFIQSSPDLFWGLIASMYLGNVLLVILNVPLIPLWVKVLKIPHVLLNILIIMFCIVGAYSINQEINDIYMCIIFGVIGFLGKKLGYESPLLILAFILGPKIEISLRQSLIMSNGSFVTFINRPISAVFALVTLFIVILAVTSATKKKLKQYDEEFEEEF
jgi:putative tricarboxylic transport membrane protein